MHTSTMLQATDFQYALPESHTQVDLQTFCPQYHPLDRIGVVSRCLEDGICHTGYALLALATAFYDTLRARSAAFFDYPHHFALLDVNAAGVRTQSGRIPLDTAAMGAPWGGLDVWPESNWIAAPDTATGMLQTVFALQLSRVFWPEGFWAEPGEPPLPVYVRRLLAARLQTVYYYNTTHPTVVVQVSPTVEDVVQRSLARLPEGDRESRPRGVSPGAIPSPINSLPYAEPYRQARVTDFLDTMAVCFEAPASV